MFQAYTLELPWRFNRPNVSCIPADTYIFKMFDSPKHGMVYEAEAVPGRTSIQIHPANWAKQLLGCIALGRAVGLVEGVEGIMGSRDAVQGLVDDLEGEPFELTIAWDLYVESRD